MTFGVDKPANGLLAVGASVAGLGANRLLAGSAGLGVVVDPNKAPKGFAASAGFAGVCSDAVFGAKGLLEPAVCPDRLPNGLLAAASAAGLGVNRLVVAGCVLLSSGFDAAASPNRGLKGAGSAGLAASSVAAGFGAKGLPALCEDKLEKGLASGDPPMAGFAANTEPALGLVSGEVCMLSSAGEVICEVDCPNKLELGVVVFCCAPNPPKDGAGAGVGVVVAWLAAPPALNPPKLNPLVPDWESPPNDVFTEKGLLAGWDPKEGAVAPKLNDG